MGDDFRALIGQLFGKNNTFGYSKTIINQAMMVYWFLGDFYTSKIFNRCITRFWVSFNVIAVVLLFAHSFFYIFFSSNVDISKMLFASQVIISIAYLHIFTPLSSHFYRNNICNTFEILDQVSLYELQTGYTEKSDEKKFNLNAAYTVLFTQIGLFSSYMTFTYLHLIIGYNVDKLSDPNYFIYPLYCENVDQLSTFVLLQISQIISALPVGPMYFLMPFFPLIVANEFYKKFQALSDSLKCHSETFRSHFEKQLRLSFIDYQEIHRIQESFERDVESYARHHHNLLRGISSLRSYLEFNMSTNLFSFLYVEIFLIHVITLIEEEPILLKMRVAANVAIFGTIQLTYCFIGKLFSDMGEMFNDAVYDTPWYYLSPSARKSVHLLLYQAQATIQFKALKIYPLNMGFFLKSCNNVYSIVNLLRRRTMSKT